MQEIRIRSATIDDIPFIEDIHYNTREKAYQGLIPTGPLKASSEAYRRRQIWRQALLQPATHQFTFLAYADAGNVFGFIHGAQAQPNAANASFIGQYPMEILSFYLLPDWQGKGLGRYLFKYAMRHMLDQGHTAFFLWVAQGNPAEQFYQCLGGEFLGQGYWDVEGYRLPNLAYGWDDIVMIVKRESKAV